MHVLLCGDAEGINNGQNPASLILINSSILRQKRYLLSITALDCENWFFSVIFLLLLRYTNIHIFTSCFLKTHKAWFSVDNTQDGKFGFVFISQQDTTSSFSLVTAFEFCTCSTQCLTAAIAIIPSKETEIWAVKTSSKIQGALKTKCIKYADHRGHSPIHFKSVATGASIIIVSFW